MSLIHISISRASREYTQTIKHSTRKKLERSASDEKYCTWGWDCLCFHILALVKQAYPVCFGSQSEHWIPFILTARRTCQPYNYTLYSLFSGPCSHSWVRFGGINFSLAVFWSCSSFGWRFIWRVSRCPSNVSSILRPKSPQLSSRVAYLFRLLAKNIG